ncbi:MAG: hypothetical protein U5L01_02145 [Rheinheimera sp.]|nr:hypothetical protein [Rheinheimera sp.]
MNSFALSPPVGLQQEVLGRRFLIEQHPRLRTILQSRQASPFFHQMTKLPAILMMV